MLKVFIVQRFYHYEYMTLYIVMKKNQNVISHYISREYCDHGYAV